MLSLVLWLACRGEQPAGDGSKDAEETRDSSPTGDSNHSAPGPDSAPPDTGGPDSGARDSGGDDSANPDTASGDTSSGDTADSGTAEEVPAGDWIWVEANDAMTCGIHADGSIECFGRDDDGIAVGVPSGSFARMEFTAGGYACALETSGRVQCWGDGVPDADLDALPDASALAVDWLGAIYVLGLDGSVSRASECNDHYDCGTPPEGSYVLLDAGAELACALDSAGEAACWGNYAEAPPAGPLIDLDLCEGWDLACALDTAGEIACWGEHLNEHGGSYDPPAGPFASIDVGMMYACALDAAGSASCWRADDSYWDYPFVDPPDYPFVQVSSGDVHVCGITTLGGMACWGLDIDGSTVPP